MKNNLTKMVAAAILLGIILVLAGCKDDGPSSKVFVKNGSGKLPRIAIIPFDAVGNIRSQDAGRVVTNTVMTYLLSTGLFEVVDPGMLDEALISNQVRITEGLKKDDLTALQKALDLDGVILGLVEEYGDVRIGNDTYPSVSFSARLINAHTGGIIWAGAISKTGADKVSIFDIGRISSMGKLCKSAVRDMASSLSKTYDQVQIALAIPQVATPQVQQAVEDHGTVIPAGNVAAVTPTAETPATPAVSGTPTASSAGKSIDESATYGESELKALLPEISGYIRGEFDYKKHTHDTIEGRYGFGGGKNFVEVKLVDYKKAVTAENFIRMYHVEEDPTKFAGVSAFISTSGFGYEHVDAAVGRFGLYVRGPAAKKDDVEKVAASVIAAIK